MVGARSHRDLVVWQKAMDLAVMTYELTKELPKSELYGLTSQLQRAATSIAANIAEGNARRTRKDYAHFITMARASAVEVDTLFEIAVRVGRLDKGSVAPAMALSDEVSRMLFALRNKLEQEGEAN